MNQQGVRHPLLVSVTATAASWLAALRVVWMVLLVLLVLLVVVAIVFAAEHWHRRLKP
jgi:protein-S-isoprenylcysteine O-methyltransferase Ste14